MKVFVAGGTGVLGRRLLPHLVATSHQVTATTRRPEKAELLASLGATTAVLDALDEQAVVEAVREAAPDTVMNQLTDLPPRYQPRKLGPFYEATGRLRVDGIRRLLQGTRAGGTRRFVYQSIAFLYSMRGPWVVDESAPVGVDAPDRDGYLDFITGSPQRGRAPIHAVRFTGAEERREQARHRDDRLHYQNVAYLTLYGAGGTPLASGQCWMSNARQAAD